MRGGRVFTGIAGKRGKAVSDLIVTPTGGNVDSPFALQFLDTRPAGTGSPAQPSTHPLYRAYPAIPYEYRHALIGGRYPYKFRLSGQPSGMTINADTGYVYWANPDTTTGTITITGRDCLGNEVSTNFVVTVSTSGFWFIDSNYGGTSTGTLSQPFKSIVEMLDNCQDLPDDIVYFRGGNYTCVEYPDSAVEPKPEPSWMDSMYVHAVVDALDYTAPDCWRKYPGETVNIDHNGVVIRTERPWFYGLHHDNCDDYGIWAGSAHYKSFRAGSWSNVTNVGTSDNENQGFIRVLDNDTTRGQPLIFQDMTFDTFIGAHGIGSVYWAEKMLVEDCTFLNGGQLGLHGFSVPIGIKQNCKTVVVRNTDIYLVTDAVEAAFYNELNPTDNIIEWSYCRIMKASAPKATWTNYQPELRCFRCTFVNVDVSFPNLDGEPSEFQFNVHENSNLIDDDSVVNEHDVLRGASGIVDANGDLEAAYSAYLGTHGRQIVSS